MMNARPRSSLVTDCGWLSELWRGVTSCACAPAEPMTMISRIHLSRIIPFRRRFVSGLGLGDVQRKVVHHKRCFQARVFSPNEINLYSLSLVSDQIERDLRIARAGIQIRVASQRRQDCAGRISDLHSQRVIGSCAGRFSSVDMEPE